MRKNSFQCPCCGIGEMVVEIVPDHHTKLGGVPVRIKDARIAKCNHCGETSVSAKEVERWLEVQRNDAATHRHGLCTECSFHGIIAKGDTVCVECRAAEADMIENDDGPPPERPCDCGHTRDQHDEVGRCDECGCEGFAPAAELPPCECGHSRIQHEMLRGGAEAGRCGECGCRGFTLSGEKTPPAP